MTALSIVRVANAPGLGSHGSLAMNSQVNHSITFLMTDIEGSTRLWEERPETMKVALAQHDLLLSQVVTDCGGEVIKSRGEGDSAFAVFPSTAEAVAASLKIQRSLLEGCWGSEEPLRVRMALHTGDAERR